MERHYSEIELGGGVSAVQISMEVVNGYVFNDKPMPEGLRVTGFRTCPKNCCVTSLSMSFGRRSVSVGDWIVKSGCDARVYSAARFTKLFDTPEDRP